MTGRPNISFAKGFDLLLIQLVLFDQLEDEFLLLVGTHPHVGGPVGVERSIPATVFPFAVTVGMGGVVTFAVSVSLMAVHAIGHGVGQKADFLNLAVYACLKQGVKPGTFLRNLGEVGEFGADTDDVRM